MPQTAADWSERLRENLQHYSEALLRQVAARLLKPRNQWPAEELIERIVQTAENAPVVDRRLRELPAGCRKLLALVGHSGQPRWRVGNLIEVLAALGEPDAVGCVTALLETGLFYPAFVEFSSANGAPETGPIRGRCKSFAHWLANAAPTQLRVWAHPEVTRRALGEDLGLPDLSAEHAPDRKTIREADGLEWLFRIAALWQQALFTPFRRTQQGDFFKRDQERLRQDPVLGRQPADALVEVPDIGQLTAALALAEGALHEREGELTAGALPLAWHHGLPAAVRSLWTALLDAQRWDPVAGAAPESPATPLPGVYLLSLLLLARLPADGWCAASHVSRWVAEHHPYWSSAREARASRPAKGGVAERFLLGVAYPMRLIQAARSGDDWLVRLSPLGRWLLGYGPEPTFTPFPQTLLVQPNLEILLYRQGTTPELLGSVGKFALWKGIGSACNLQLAPETVYKALEAGESFASILNTLTRHGMKPVPPPVVESLRTWAQKRDRITVYPSATLLEFLSPEDLDDALARGIPATRIAPRLAVVTDESTLELHHFRLRGSRDYTLPPEPCVTPGDDGVTLEVDLGRSDLMLESELSRFAEEVSSPSPGAKTYRLTPASLAQARDSGLTFEALDRWFLERCSRPAPPAARLLMTAGASGPLRLRRLIVLQAPSVDIADGLEQWPQTRRLITERVGPTALAVAEENLAALREVVQALGIELAQQ